MAANPLHHGHRTRIADRSRLYSQSVNSIKELVGREIERENVEMERKLVDRFQNFLESQDKRQVDQQLQFFMNPGKRREKKKNKSKML